MRIAIIPARGGSKRILNKNIREFLGVPIIGRVITTLKESQLFDRIVVSTDSSEIASLAIEFGAEVPFRRPDHLADDFAGTGEVVLHCIQELNLSSDPTTQICCVYPTSVLMQVEELDKALRMLDSGGWKYVFAASSPNSSPLRSFTRSETGGINMLFPEFWESRSQDLPSCFVDAGFFYWASAGTWIEGLPIFGTYSTIVEVSDSRAVDINTEDDWQRAEFEFQKILRESSPRSKS